jgi:hypothetical protein
VSRAVSGSSWAVRHGTALAVLALVVLSLALHARALSFDFVNFDDPTVLLAHPQLYDETSFTSSLSQIFFEAFPREEPLLLRDVSWALDARVFGFQNPLGYHLGNVLLNAANVALLFLFLARATRRFGLSLAVAGVFAVLPVHVEPVSWVMGRKDTLSAFFVLAALLAQSYELDEPDARRRRQLYLATLLCTCLALVAKIAAMPCFVVLALHRAFYPYLDGRRAPDAPIGVLRTLRVAIPPVLPHAVMTLAIVAWYQAAVAEYGVTGWRGRGPLDPQHLANVAAFTPLIIGSYLKSLAWPAQLSVFYRWPHVEIPLSGLERFASVAIALAIVAAVVYCCRRRRDLAFYLLAFLSLLLPYLNVVYVDIWRANRYVYLASFCALAVPAILLAQLYTRGSRSVRLAITGATLCFAFASTAQTLRLQAVWRDDASLWRYEAALDEPSLLAIQSLATSTVQQAEHATDPVRRHELAGQARSEIERGLARDRVLGRRPAGYATSEPLQVSRLHTLLGRLGALEGESLEAQLAHYATAHAIAPNRASAFLLAKLYLELSERAPAADRERLVRSSWNHFMEYVAQSGRDPVQAARNEGMITAIYEQRYPFLRPEIVAARRSLQ